MMVAVSRPFPSREVYRALAWGDTLSSSRPVLGWPSQPEDMLPPPSPPRTETQSMPPLWDGWAVWAGGAGAELPGAAPWPPSRAVRPPPPPSRATSSSKISFIPPPPRLPPLRCPPLWGGFPPP